MDLSKLPKLSQTPAPPDHSQPSAPGTATAQPKVELFCRCGAPIMAGTNFCSHCGASYGEATGARSGGGGDTGPAMGTGAEAWLSIAIGAILIFLSPRIWQFYLMPAKFTWTFNDAQGNPLAYPKTEYYWADLGLAGFAIVLFLEGLVMMLTRKAPLVMVAFALTVVATGLNLYVLSRTYNVIGFQIFNALAAAFGIYIGLCEFAQLRSLRSQRR